VNIGPCEGRFWSAVDTRALPMSMILFPQLNRGGKIPKLKVAKADAFTAEAPDA
jgi:hypothetical protein